MHQKAKSWHCDWKKSPAIINALHIKRKKSGIGIKQFDTCNFPNSTVWPHFFFPDSRISFKNLPRG